MDVQTINACKLVLPSGAVETYPPGWSGDVPAAVGNAWIAAGDAQPILPEPGQFTPLQTAVLQGAANEIIKSSGLDQLPPSEPLVLDDLTVAELREIAAGAGIDVPKSAKKADIIMAILARQDEIAAAAEAQAPSGEAA